MTETLADHLLDLDCWMRRNFPDQSPDVTVKERRKIFEFTLKGVERDSHGNPTGASFFDRKDRGEVNLTWEYIKSPDLDLVVPNEQTGLLGLLARAFSPAHEDYEHLPRVLRDGDTRGRDQLLEELEKVFTSEALTSEPFTNEAAKKRIVVVTGRRGSGKTTGVLEALAKGINVLYLDLHRYYQEALRAGNYESLPDNSMRVAEEIVRRVLRDVSRYNTGCREINKEDSDWRVVQDKRRKYKVLSRKLSPEKSNDKGEGDNRRRLRGKAVEVFTNLPPGTVVIVDHFDLFGFAGQAEIALFNDTVLVRAALRALRGGGWLIVCCRSLDAFTKQLPPILSHYTHIEI